MWSKASHQTSPLLPPPDFRYGQCYLTAKPYDRSNKNICLANRKGKKPMTKHYPPDPLHRQQQPDTLLLLPLLESAAQESAHDPCLHIVHLSLGQLGFCNVSTREHCPVCLRPVCQKHQSLRELALLDQGGVAQAEELHALCETCATLPQPTLIALQTCRLGLYGPADERTRASGSGDGKGGA
jgi:hypothetical protein